MPLIFQLLADAILVLHAALVLFVIVSLPVTWIGSVCGWRFVRSFSFRMTHLALIGVVAAESVFGIVCPLTTWEDALRARAGGAPRYDDGYVAYWVHRFLFHDWSEAVFTTLYISFFVLVALTFLFIPPRAPRIRQRGNACQSNDPS